MQQVNIGNRVTYKPFVADPLRPGAFEGLLVDMQSTQAGNVRYRIRLDRYSSSDSHRLEVLLYSNEGEVSAMTSEVSVKDLKAGDCIDSAICPVLCEHTPFEWKWFKVKTVTEQGSRIAVAFEDFDSVRFPAATKVQVGIENQHP